MPQTQVGRFDFLETNYGKILHEMSEGFTLYALELSALLNEQSTILKVVFGGAAVELVLHWEFLQIPELPCNSVFFEGGHQTLHFA